MTARIVKWRRALARAQEVDAVQRTLAEAADAPGDWHVVAPGSSHEFLAFGPDPWRNSPPILHWYTVDGFLERRPGSADLRTCWFAAWNSTDWRDRFFPAFGPETTLAIARALKKGVSWSDIIALVTPPLTRDEMTAMFGRSR